LPTEHPTGPHNYWVRIDVAAAALGVSVPTAYRLAIQEKWRHTRTKPRGYLWHDIRETATKRKGNQ
jgi:hypothetical protein